ncbi:hypothetical protein [Bradyrhizobium sp. USDA 4486]
MKVWVFGDESSSSSLATYGLIAFLEADLPRVAQLVSTAKATLKAKADAPLHCKVLFHRDRRQKSAFANATRQDVHAACLNLIAGVAAMTSTFFFGHLSRGDAPKVLHVPMISDEPDVVTYHKMKVELEHLQYLAYGAAATRACDTLRYPATQVVVDENKSVVRWFNERAQASRLLERFAMNAALPIWPKITLADDADHPGLQIADVLTYVATKQFADPAFAKMFDLIRFKAHFMTYEFAEQVRTPYVPPPGVTVRDPPRNR